MAIWFIIYIISNVYIFKELQHVSTFESLYWVISTITTVGYGDITPISWITKTMAMILMVVGVAVVGYINGVIVTSIVENVKD